MIFQKTLFLLVLASEHYDPDEYIRDYDEFVGIVKRTEGNGGEKA